MASLSEFLTRRVVLNTQGPLLYIGVLEDYDDRGYWLTEADVHDRSEGHSTNEHYVNDAALLEQAGTRHANRRRVFVERHAIVSISLLEDVIAEGPVADAGWLP